MTNTAAIESLRSFAVEHGELAFAHLCTQALPIGGWVHGGIYVEPINGSQRQVIGGSVVDIKICDPRTTITRATVNVANLQRIEGEAWAIERIAPALEQHAALDEGGTWTLIAIRATDTTRPDGAIAKGIEV